MVSRTGMLAPDGRCKVLDATADGYVRGEACRALWLDTATASSSGGGSTQLHHEPLAILRGTSVNTNGRAGSLTAPHGPSQQVCVSAPPC